MLSLLNCFEGIYPCRSLLNVHPFTYDQQAKVSEEDAQMQDEPERPWKRLRLKHQKTDAASHSQQSPISAPFALKTPKTEPGEPETYQTHVGNKGKQLVSSPEISQRTRSGPEQASQTLQIKEQKASVTSKETQPYFTVMKPNDEPFTDDMLSLTPLAVVFPGNLLTSRVSSY